VQRKLHQTIKRVTHDFQGRWHFNTCIAAVMELVNEIYGAEEAIAAGRIPRPCSLSCSATSRCCWLHGALSSARIVEMTGETCNLLKAPWPKYDPALAAEDEIEIPVQVNGSCAAW